MYGRPRSVSCRRNVNDGSRNALIANHANTTIRMAIVVAAIGVVVAAVVVDVIDIVGVTVAIVVVHLVTRLRAFPLESIVSPEVVSYEIPFPRSS